MKIFLKLLLEQGSQRSFLDDLGVIDITPIDVEEGDATDSGLHSMLYDDLESLTGFDSLDFAEHDFEEEEAPPINDENALVLHTSDAKSLEEDTSRKKEINDEPLAKKLKILILTLKIPSPTPLKTIKPESLSNPDTAKALGIPPPFEFSTFGLSVLVLDKKRKRSLKILKEELVFQREEEFHLATTAQLTKLQSSIQKGTPETKEMINKMELTIKAKDDVEQARLIVKDNLDGLGQHM
uniref:Uncharacterized protein n=1 Tax=Tanacetum cinerariifolium TaxID=118510 RepID=A0A6L2MBK2_TANCI|nr:hypothetical protein [Tanacetum cinerariifolium]